VLGTGLHELRDALCGVRRRTQALREKRRSMRVWPPRIPQLARQKVSQSVRSDPTGGGGDPVELGRGSTRSEPACLATVYGADLRLTHDARSEVVCCALFQRLKNAREASTLRPLSRDCNVKKLVQDDALVAKRGALAGDEERTRSVRFDLPEGRTVRDLWVEIHLDRATKKTFGSALDGCGKRR
jgi:hypothetical protein